ncbi:tRNA lysidine(34) synthetase TilS [Sphingobacterium hungaricum]|uniref:tRNA(Ile)-lysidine synthase n=1 Tax=Sphingobacterium hungaricum TaxID=2082723 RepID=A0A928YQ85_9SPHI|nr:tRNA lysidine(34) synthetase TilS [Sphingobacterium hungaricum]MBE8713322.1 tRNA lysidine(34) synthetase TilS [Sphingobacterium hungaricum]
MDFLGQFQRYILDNQLLGKDDTVVLAVSGGKDSMVMTELFYRSGYSIILAHCNFNLRGEESDLDEKLVRKYALNHKLPFFVKSFDTEKFADQHKISIQVSARELRYAWFEELRIEQEAQYIAVAQHSNDQVETVLLNLTRGTGLKGLCGIQPIRDKILRPILHFTSQDVQDIAKQWNVPFRDDASNFETKYSRNKIRLKVVPLLREINPEFDKTFIQSIQNFNDSYSLLNEFLAPVKKALFQSVSETLFKIEKIKLQVYLNSGPMVFALFNEFNFSKAILQDLKDSWENGSGRIFESSSHELLLDREYIWLRKLQSVRNEEELLIEHRDVDFQFMNKKYLMEVNKNTEINNDEGVAQFDFDKLTFPLTLRRWKNGDKFVPLGMRGFKKVSDYLIGIKLNLFEKDEVCVLLNGNNDIMWVVNNRIDNRYKLTRKTQKVVTLVCEN